VYYSPTYSGDHVTEYEDKETWIIIFLRSGGSLKERHLLEDRGIGWMTILQSILQKRNRELGAD
jgi:hypothetical protein